MKTCPYIRLSAAPALLLALLSPLRAQEISFAARSQIKALQDEKAARTPVQQKMDSQLLYGAVEKRGGRIAEGKTSVTADAQSRRHAGAGGHSW